MFLYLHGEGTSSFFSFRSWAGFVGCGLFGAGISGGLGSEFLCLTAAVFLMLFVWKEYSAVYALLEGYVLDKSSSYTYIAGYVLGEQAVENPCAVALA